MICSIHTFKHSIGTFPVDLVELKEYYSNMLRIQMYDLELSFVALRRPSNDVIGIGWDPL